jgi:hypothetical protein
MQQENNKPKNSDKYFWRSSIALIVILLIVLTASILVILFQGGHSISGKDAAQGAAFPIAFFIPIWVAIAQKKARPTPPQTKIIRIMLITALILLLINILAFIVL